MGTFPPGTHHQPPPLLLSNMKFSTALLLLACLCFTATVLASDELDKRGVETVAVPQTVVAAPVVETVPKTVVAAPAVQTVQVPQKQVVVAATSSASSLAPFYLAW